MYESTPFMRYLKKQYNLQSSYVYNPCMSNWTPMYMNRKDVLEAIHASAHYTRPWPSHPPGWEYGSELADVNLIYPEFFANAPQWKITVVSGDADAAGYVVSFLSFILFLLFCFIYCIALHCIYLLIVPFMGTQRWIECLGQPVVRDWNNWWLDEDVAGSYKIYEGITFQTVKGCGHTIPTYCPVQGFLFFEQYINGTFSSQNINRDPNIKVQTPKFSSN
ncbi:hypothetical protein RFI_12614 [Reticulomyxa filosa]|uniref:Serine carboxypeptidase n=1 Tax=Reticulomyxa filosa TaxID=46433 RepID=X6NFM1_RETFI|nr:hypothetical protein RFI_12614 [Reticulomyxa filosa]|eukprot:ETO24544.1 hypothetical protein RFI_12614 [Reticulomyxa filosa]